MIVRNGRAGAGWRLDEVKEGMASGMEMLMNPFAIVPKEENADRIVAAFEQRDELLEALMSLVEEAAAPLDVCENCGCINDALCSFHVAEKVAKAAIAKAEGKATV